MTFEEFAASRLPAVLAFAAVLTGQRATAEDIAQEVLIRACARWDTIGGLDRPEFYVRKMVLNEFLSWRRRSWSRTGILAFDWSGSAGGEYLLNTNTAGGNLLADSRNALCLARWAPSSVYLFSTYDGYLTPDGTTIIAPVAKPIPLGQIPPSCSGPSQPSVAQPTPGPTPPATAELEEFSATTGQAVGILYASQSHGANADSPVYWSNPSGSVVVVEGKAAHGSRSQWDFGVLSGSTFTPIPGSSSPPLIPQLAF